MTDVLIKAFELGCKFDGWQEHFKYDKWMEAFEFCGVDPDFYRRERSYDEILPWDFIDVGVRKEFLIKEYENALNGVVTGDCRDNCLDCGVNVDLLGREC